MKPGLFVGAALLAATFSPIDARATVITFDSLSGNYTAIPNGYGGLNWTNWFLLGVASYPYNPSGYVQGLISPPNIAYQAGDPYVGVNGPGTFSSVTPFTLNSFYVTAAWKNDLSVTVSGYLGASPVDTKTFNVSTAAPTLAIFNWTDITSVVLSTSGGTWAGYTCLGANCGNRGPSIDDEVALDNVTINAATPLPAALPLFATGLGVMGLVGWRRKRKNAAAIAAA